MSLRLRSLPVVVGLVVATGAAYTINQVSDRTTRAQLIDAGIAQCPPVLVRAFGRCESGQRYRAFRVKARLCPGNNVVLPRAPDGCEVFRPDLLKFVDGGCGDPDLCAGQDDGTARPDVFDCACREAAGPCVVDLLDGGRGPAPFGVTLGDGYPYGNPTGTGCRRKPCGEAFGDTSWPVACPVK